MYVNLQVFISGTLHTQPSKLLRKYLVLDFIMMMLLKNDFRNIPNIHKHEKRDNKYRWHGAEVQLIIEGNWTTYRVCIYHFLYC